MKLEQKLEKKVKELQNFILEHKNPNQVEIAEYLILFKEYHRLFDETIEAGWSIEDLDEFIDKTGSELTDDESQYVHDFIDAHLPMYNKFISGD